MEQLTIRQNDHSCTDTCPLCGLVTPSVCGPRLFLDEGEEPVCRRCGQQHVPNLVALLDLAQVAERVGRSSRHILVPPMEALLALARAAENYTFANPHFHKQVV